MPHQTQNNIGFAGSLQTGVARYVLPVHAAQKGAA
jgi:hypothetical protein